MNTKSVLFFGLFGLIQTVSADALFQQKIGDGIYMDLNTGKFTLPMGKDAYLTPDNHIERRISGRNSAVIDLDTGDIALPYGDHGGVIKKNGDIVIPVDGDYLQDDENW